MARYIQQEVANIADEPAEGEEVSVVVGVGEGSLPDIKERAWRADASAVEELPFNSLRIELPEAKLGQLFDVPGIESVECDDGMEVLSGN